MQSTHQMRRVSPTWLAAMAVAVAFASALAFPPVRAAADRLLSVFRVQQIVFLPISEERLSQLRGLNFDGKTLFIAEPQVDREQVPPQKVGSAQEAAAAAGFTPAEVTAPLGNSAAPEYSVGQPRTVSAQVNVAAARQLLALLGITDATVPDALGAAPITAKVGSMVETRYAGQNGTLTLYQGASPEVALPDGVNMAELGTLFLRVLGSDAATADALSRQIDWSSTLVLPFPANVNNARIVTVGGTQALLLGSGGGGEGRGWSLAWQRGDRFYQLHSSGRVSDSEIIAAAESVR